MSVPQMAERCTLISTSLWPTEGSGTSCIQMPGSARALTSAFMLPLVNDAEVACRATKCGNNLIELLRCVRSIHLGPNPRFSMRHDRKSEGHDIDAFILHPFGEAHHQGRIPQH